MRNSQALFFWTKQEKWQDHIYKVFKISIISVGPTIMLSRYYYLSRWEVRSVNLSCQSSGVNEFVLFCSSDWHIKMSFAVFFLMVLTFPKSFCDFDCQTSFVFKKVCHFYAFQNECQPFALEKCRPIRTKQHYDKCPTYSCVNIFNAQFLFSVKMLRLMMSKLILLKRVIFFCWLSFSGEEKVILPWL